MSKIGIILCVTFLIVSCNSSKNVAKVENIQEEIKTTPEFEKQIKGVDFYAYGTDPAWSLEIDFDNYVKCWCEENNEALEIPIKKLGQEDELPVVNYQIRDESADIEVEIQRNRQESESDKPYIVNMKVNFEDQDETKEFSGKGEYFGNIALHCDWWFEELNGEAIPPSKNGKLPNMEIYLDKNKVAGFLGCNTFAADIFFGRSLLFFHHITMTKKACLDSNVESKLLAALNKKQFQYRIEDDRLFLTNEQTKLVLKKVNKGNL